MIKNSVIKLTLSYILIISILSLSLSTFIYLNLVKNSTELFKQEQTRIEKKFGIEDPRYIKKLHFVEESVSNVQNRLIINLLGLNFLIVTIVGILAYFFAKRTFTPIEESLRKQKEFISNVSHELKTPLTALKTTFEIDLKSKDSDLKETIKSGIEEVDKLNSLVNGFLKLSKFDSKKPEIKNEVFKLSDIIEDIVKRHQHSIISKNLSLKIDITENKLKSDKFLLTEVLTIIIDNAIKFSPENEEIVITSYKEGKYDYISIKDRGRGIKEENLDKIFERFYKEDSSRSVDSGLGIGLALAKEISEFIDCQITAKRNKDVGSEFILKFSALFQN